MARYLITGGAGFIGSHLADLLIARGDSVVVLDNLSTGLAGNLDPAATLIRGDIADADAVARAMDGADGCFHLAAIASVQQYRDGWSAASTTNLIGSVTVLDAAARAGVPVVYASSAAVYGDNPDVPLAEDAGVAPISGYGADKLGLELHAGAMRDTLGLASVGLRFFNVFGPRQAPGSPYSGVISIFLDHLTQGKGITIFGDGGQARDFVYVADVAAGLAAAMAHAQSGGSGVFNIARQTAMTITGLAEALGGILGVTPDITYAQARAGDIRMSLGNPARAAKVLGFAPQVEITDGLARTAAWFKSRD